MMSRFCVLYLVAILLCLSFCSCKNEQTSEDQKTDLEEAQNDSSEVDMKKKNIILHKTKAQYVIY